MSRLIQALGGALLFSLALQCLPALAQPQAQGGAASPIVPAIARTEYDMRELAQRPHLSDAESAGRRLFVQYCALCHDATGQPTHGTYGPELTHDLLAAIGDARARTSVLKGTDRMPGFQYQLSTGDVDNILTFVKTMPSAAPISPVSHHAKSPSESEAEVSITGSAEGAGVPLEGVAVSARMEDSTITTTVFTDDAGRYAFPPLRRGAYRIWAQAVGYKAAYKEVTIGAAPAPLPLHLTKSPSIEDVYAQLSTAEWLDALPERTRADQRMREVFRLNCTECHGANVALERRFDERGWAAIIRFMEQGDYGGWMGASADPKHDTENVGFGPSIKHHANELAEYLARVRGPHSPPLQVKVLPRPTGAEARVIVTGYDIPPSETPHELAWWDGTEWSEGAATGMHGAGGMHDVSVDAKGNAWLTESLANDARTITRVDSSTGQITGFGLPAVAGSPWKADISHGIFTDVHGTVWFGELGKLGKINPATQTFQTFQIPAPSSLASLWDANWKAMGIPAPMQKGSFLLGTIEADAKDKLWATAFIGVWHFDPLNNTFAYYHDLSLPTETPAPPERFNMLFTYGVAGDARGNGWWTTPNDDRVVTANTRTGEVHEIVMRPPWYTMEESLSSAEDRSYMEAFGSLKWHGIRPGAQYPRRLGADKSGTTVWVPNWWGRNLAKIDINTRAVTYYKLPINAQPYFVSVARNHLVWIALTDDDRVASFDPATERWAFYRLPINGCEARQMTVDFFRGDLWVPCYRASKVYRIQLKTS
jgi:streptogramin lyase/mono/diheme cytochrome c family protein